MTWQHCLFAVATVVALPAWSLGAEGQGAPAAPQSPAGTAPNEWSAGGPVFTDGRPRADGEPLFLTRGQSPSYHRDLALRLGGWGINVDGSPIELQDYQNLHDSVFWDVDGLFSDGDRTLNFSLTGLDREATQVGAYYYGPGYSGQGLSIDFQYERFFRALDFRPVDNFGSMTSDLPVVAENTYPGRDYAIRVQELKTRFKGRLSENVQWRLNLWGMRKFGERQVTSPAHCQNIGTAEEVSSHCHVLSQRQQIDWLTMEIEPVLEGRWGPVCVAYSRPMRSFVQDDEVITRSYNHFGVFQEPDGPFANVPVAVAMVPDNFTQIDQLKLGWELPNDNNFYGLVWNGNTENRQRDMNRHFYGYDFRLTNRAVDGLSVTAYAKKKVELNETPPFFLENEGEPIVNPASIGVTEEELLGGIRFSDVRHPVDYNRNQVGIKARWSPFRGNYGSEGLALTGGYEYYDIYRSYVTYVIGDTDNPTRTPLEQLLASGDARLFVLPNTHGNEFYVGADKRWSPTLDTYIRYTMRVVDDPLVGIRLSDEQYVADGNASYMADTNQPEHEDLVQIGGTWVPTYSFLLSGWVGLEKHYNRSPYANFDQNNYPIVVTAWYAPTPRWSFSGGLGYYTDFIGQDITLGFREESSNPARSFPAFTERWGYTGRAQVYNFGARFAYTPRVILRGDVEWVRGKNEFFAPSAPDTDLSALPALSDTIVETTRISAGIDWLMTERISSFFRYNYYDYNDESAAYNSGTANMFLGGLTAIF
jgi:hypothetical protein